MHYIRLTSSFIPISSKIGTLIHSPFAILPISGNDAKSFAEILLPLLDSWRTEDEIVSAMPEELGCHVSDFLRILEKSGVLEKIDCPGNLFDARWLKQEQFFQFCGGAFKTASGRLGKSKILLIGLEPWGAVAASELAASGIGSLFILDNNHIVPSDLLYVHCWNDKQIGALRREAISEFICKNSPWCQITTASFQLNDEMSIYLTQRDWDLVLVTSEDLSTLLTLGKLLNKTSLPTLYARINGLEAHVGPIVTPNKTACWNCCRQRLLANTQKPLAEYQVQQFLFKQPSNSDRQISLSPMPSLVGNLIALEALKFLTDFSPSKLNGAVLIQNLLTFEASLHSIIPIPWCEVCGGPSNLEHNNNQSKQILEIRSIRDVYNEFSDWLDRRTGIISHLEIQNKNLELQIGTFSEVFLSKFTETNYRAEAFEICGGKGRTELEATLGAIGEAFERYSASRICLENLMLASMDMLQGEVLSPAKLCLYVDEQYNRPHFNFVRFDSNARHLWTRGKWIDTGELVWVPALLTFYTFPLGDEVPFCQVSTNGLATGVSVEDASLRAIFELIERDAFMITWLCKLSPCRVAVDNSLNDMTREIIENLHKCGLCVELYLLNVGLSIPVIMCMGLGDELQWPGVSVACAAHMNPQIACYKAVLELSFTAFQLSRVMASNQFSIPKNPQQVYSFLDHGLFYVPKKRVSCFDFIRKNSSPVISISDLNEPSTISLEMCSKHLEKNGIRVACVDLTPPDVYTSSLRVVRALGTMMQPIHCGYGLERLDNPRLQTLSNGEINSNVHPFI
jgi:ribosomal protein S12 methylthiotransferase accessory factor